MNKKGFTLVEIIVVVALMGLILTLATTGIMNFRKKANEKALNSKIYAIEVACATYGQNHGNRIKDEIINGVQGSSPICDVGSYINASSTERYYVCSMSLRNVIANNIYKEESRISSCFVENPLGGCLDDRVVDIYLNKDHNTAAAVMKE